MTHMTESTAVTSSHKLSPSNRRNRKIRTSFTQGQHSRVCICRLVTRHQPQALGFASLRRLPLARTVHPTSKTLLLPTSPSNLEAAKEPRSTYISRSLPPTPPTPHHPAHNFHQPRQSCCRDSTASIHQLRSARYPTLNHTAPLTTSHAMSSEGEQTVKLVSSDNVEIVTGMRATLHVNRG